MRRIAKIILDLDLQVPLISFKYRHLLERFFKTIYKRKITLERIVLCCQRMRIRCESNVSDREREKKNHPPSVSPHVARKRRMCFLYGP